MQLTSDDFDGVTNTTLDITEKNKMSVLTQVCERMELGMENLQTWDVHTMSEEAQSAWTDWIVLLVFQACMCAYCMDDVLEVHVWLK